MQNGLWHESGMMTELRSLHTSKSSSSILQGTYFSFPSPSRQEKLRRCQIYGTLRRQQGQPPETTDDPAPLDDEGFYTPELDETSLIRSIRKDIIHPV